MSGFPIRLKYLEFRMAGSIPVSGDIRNAAHLDVLKVSWDKVDIRVTMDAQFGCALRANFKGHLFFRLIWFVYISKKLVP